MAILRLAYTTFFLIALMAVFEAWSQVGGQSHLDLMPWYLKLVLGGGAAYATMRATAAAVANKNTWNGATLRWFGILLLLLIGCGLASYYVHVYDEDEDDNDDDQATVNSAMVVQYAVPESLAGWHCAPATAGCFNEPETPSPCVSGELPSQPVSGPVS